jgi:HSP20 family protein
MLPDLGFASCDLSIQDRVAEGTITPLITTYASEVYMLDSLKSTGKSIGREITRAWGSVAEGWSELLSRSGSALTHFTHPKGARKEEPEEAATGFPRWSILAGEVEESADDIVVRLEVPGLEKEDCEITIDGNMLRLTGSKQLERDTDTSTYHLMERAYGTFQRTVMLPRIVDTEKAKATFKNGVLTVRLPKLGTDGSRSIRVN